MNRSRTSPASRSVGLTLLLWMGASGCPVDYAVFDLDGSGDDSTGERSIDLTGSWVGTWTSAGAESSGAFSGQLVQAYPIQVTGGPGAAVTGSITLAGSACFGTLSVSAAALPAIPYSLPPRLDGYLVDGEQQIEFTLKVATGADELSGTFEVASGTCTGDTGTFDAKRSLPLQDAPPPSSSQPYSVHRELIREPDGTVVLTIRYVDCDPSVMEAPSGWMESMPRAPAVTERCRSGANQRSRSADSGTPGAGGRRTDQKSIGTRRN